MHAGTSRRTLPSLGPSALPIERSDQVLGIAGQVIDHEGANRLGIPNRHGLQDASVVVDGVLNQSIEVQAATARVAARAPPG